MAPTHHFCITIPQLFELRRVHNLVLRHSPNHIQVVFFKVPQIVVPTSAGFRLETGAVAIFQFVGMENSQWEEGDLEGQFSG